MNVLIRRFVILAIDLGYAAEQVSVRGPGLQGNDLIGFLSKSCGIAAMDGYAGQGPMRFDNIRPQANRIAPFRLGAVDVAQLIECQAELVVRYGIVGIALLNGLERVDG